MLSRDDLFMAVCKNYLKVAYTVTGTKEALVTRLRCKQWTCDYCADKNARIWQYWLIKRLPEVSLEWYLVTLTANSQTRSTLASLKNLRAGIDALIKRVRRVWGNNISYVRVFEMHPTSEAVHVHFIMAGITPYVVNGFSVKHRPMAIGVTVRKGHVGTWSAKTWFKKNAQELKMGYIADVKPLIGTPEQAAFYVTKYLTKDMQSIHVAYLRHVQVTQDIGKPAFDVKHTWTPASYITSRTFDEPNTKITDIDNGFVIDNNYWEHTGFYPSE